MLELYANIKKAREARGMSQDELARLVGFKSRSSINKIELGVNDITQSKLVAIANALHTTPAALMGDDKQVPTPTITPQDEREIEHDLEDMINSMASAAYESGNGEQEDIEALKATLRAAMIQAKRIAKKKYTPRKYRKE